MAGRMDVILSPVAAGTASMALFLAESVWRQGGVSGSRLSLSPYMGTMEFGDG